MQERKWKEKITVALATIVYQTRVRIIVQTRKAEPKLIKIGIILVWRDKKFCTADQTISREGIT